MQDTINSLLEYGYIILFIYSLGGGMVGLLAAAILAGTGKMDLHLSILVAFVANLIGSTLTYLVCRYYKKDLMPYFKKHRRKLALAVFKVKQYGVFLLIIQKFIYGLKTFIPMASGIAKYDFVKFSIINTLATILWAFSLGYLGFVFGLSIEKIFDKIGSYSFAAPLFLLVLIGVIWLYLAKFSKKKH